MQLRSSNGQPSARPIFFISFLPHSYLQAHFSIVLILLANITKRLTKLNEADGEWVSEMVIVRKKERRHVKIACTCVITDGKFRLSGILGMVTKPVTGDLSNPSYHCWLFFGECWWVVTVDMTVTKSILIYDGSTGRVTCQRVRATHHDGNGAQP